LLPDRYDSLRAQRKNLRLRLRLLLQHFLQDQVPETVQPLLQLRKDRRTKQQTILLSTLLLDNIQFGITAIVIVA
jgi:hypothetical protein